MDDVHGAHGTAGVVEDPVLLEVDVCGRPLAELGDDVGHDVARVVAVGGDCALGHVAQVVNVEDVEPVEVLLDQPDDRRQQAGHDGEDGQQAAETTAGSGGL